MGQLTLTESSIVYIDTAICSYSVEAKATYFDVLQPLWQKLQAKEIQVTTSELTLMEVLITPLRNSNELLINSYERMLLAGEINLIPLSQSILRRAAQIRATADVRTPDAIHIATAVVSGCNMFITNDKTLRKIEEIPIVVISELLGKK